MDKEQLPALKELCLGQRSERQVQFRAPGGDGGGSGCRKEGWTLLGQEVGVGVVGKF